MSESNRLNSLKTIYSRITTLSDAKDILESVGVAINEIGENGEVAVRDVSDILGELSGVWDTLSDSQRQNIGVTVAGRNQLSRFLALMNNWETSVKATSVAYNSQGSALREQTEYMDSYEAKINQVKTRITELALSIGEAFLSEGLFMSIEIIGDLIEKVIDFIDKFGVLPALFGTVTAGLGILSRDGFGGIAKTISGTISATAGDVGAFISAMSSDMLTAGSNVEKSSSQMITSFRKTSAEAKVLKGALGGALGGALLNVGIVAGIALIGFAIEKLVSKMQEARKEEEEWNKLLESSLKTYNDSGNNINGLIDRYEELNIAYKNNREAMTTEELEEYNGLVRQLSDILPNSIDRVDAKGESHLKSADAIREEAKWLEELAKIEADSIAMDMTAEFESRAEAINKISEAQEKLASREGEIEKSREEAERLANDRWSAKNRRIGEEALAYINSGQAEAEMNAKLIKLEREYALALSDTAKYIGETSEAILLSEGNTTNLNDTTRALINNFAVLNRESLDVSHIEDYDERIQASDQAMANLSETTVELGKKLNDMYGELTEGLDGAELDEMTASLDSLVSAIPEDAWLMPDGTFDTVEMDNYIDTMGILVQSVRDGDGDYQSMIGTLERMGYTSNDATKFVAELARTLDNNAIKSAVAREELEYFNEELSDTAEFALNAINPLQDIFGYNETDVSSIQSYLEQIKILKGTTEDWQNTSFGQTAIDQISGYFGVSRDYIAENSDSLLQGMQAMTSMSVQNYDVLNEAGEQMLNEAGEVIQEYGFVFAEGTSQQAKDFAIEMYYAGLEGGRGFSSNFAQSVGAMNYITEEMVTKMKAELATLAKDPEGNFASFFNTLQSHLNVLEGSFTLVKDETGKLKLAMADGTKSEYLDMVNGQLEDLDMNVSWVQDSTSGLWQVLIEDPNGNGAPVVSKVTEQAKDGTMAIDELKESYIKFRQEADYGEDSSAYLDTIYNQMVLVGEELMIMDEGTENAKVTFADGGSSPWLDEINRQLEDAEGLISLTRDGNGDLRLELAEGGHYALLDEIFIGAEQAKTKIEETESAVSNLKSSFSKGAPSHINPNEGGVNRQNSASGTIASSAIDEMDKMIEKIDEINTKEITPNVSSDVGNQLATVNANIDGTKTKVATLKTDITSVDSDMSMVHKSLGDVLNLGSGLSGIVTMSETLRDALSKARAELESLIRQSQLGGINLDSFRTSIESVEGLVGRMRISVDSIRAIYADMVSSTANLGNALDLEPIRIYQTGFNLNLLKINSDYDAHIAKIQANVNSFKSILMSSDMSLSSHKDKTLTSLSVMGVGYTSFKTTAVKRIEELALSVTNRYGLMVITMGTKTLSMRNTMSTNMQKMKSETVSAMDSMSDAMVKSFQDGVDKIEASAKQLPSLIGGGIRNNIENASSAISDLANTLVTNFKSALGIHSPSRVFEELGGFVMQGLANGLSDGNLLDLGQKVFSDFGNGAFSSIDMIKGYLSADWAVANGDVKDWIASAVGITGVDASWIAPLTQIAIHESGGNPRAQNDWDINAQNGIPSKGLMQTIEPTFASNMMQGFGDIWNPVHNTIASIQYILKRYGSVFNVPGIKGIMNGTGYVGYGESIGTSPSIEGSSFSSDVGSYASAFSISAQYGGESSGDGASSAVGNMMPTINSFTASAVREDRYEREETMEDLKVIDWRKREADVYSAMIRRANTELKALNENTIKYRNALVEVSKQEEEYKKRLQAQLSNQKNIHKSLASQLKTLSNTSKHTIEQRKRYNELQTQFESSLSTIYDLENEVRGLELSISDRTIAIFEDYLTEIVGKYAKAIDSSNAKIDNIDFALSVNGFKENQNLLDNMRLENEKYGHLLGQEKTIRNQISDLNSAYTNAQKRYGKNSQQATLAYEVMLKAEEELEDSILARLSQEKKISDERKRASEDGVKNIKAYYGTIRDITASALEVEREELKKNHDLKMGMYDEEIARINSIYDAKIESLDANKEEDKYNEEVSKKNAQRVELMNRMAMVSRDNSLDGKKQLADLQKELGTLNEEILTLQSDRQEKLYRDAIDAQRKQQIEVIESQKETAEKEYEIKEQSIELQIVQAKEAYDSMINNDSMWKDLSDKYMSGDTSPMMSMIQDMENQMAKMMSGDYSSIIPDFKGLSKELKDKISSGNMLELGNMTLGMEETLREIKEMTSFMDRYRTSGALGTVDYNNPSIMDDNYKAKYTSSVDIYAPKNTAPVPSKKPEPPKPQRQHSVKAGDTLWDLAQQFYGNPFKWTTIAQANKNPDPYKLQIGQKLIIPFKSGGYTGNWSGDEGKIAMLHKKELVLNAEQTQHILSSAKIMDSVMKAMPKMKMSNNMNLVGEGNSSQSVVIQNMSLEFDNFKGTKENANQMVKEFLTGLKKI